MAAQRETREYLGVGWKFPLQVTPAGGMARARYELRVEESVYLILATARGERVMMPDFGCGIHDLVFETATDQMIGRVQSEVTDAITKWEPRVDLLSVQAQPDVDDRTRLLIEIEYRIRSTNSRFNLVFPFYVQ